MKKNFFILAAGLPLLLASCTNNDDPTFERTVGYNVCNLIVPVDQSQKPYAQTGSFTFVTESYAGTVKVGSEGVSVNNTTYPIQTSNLPMASTNAFSFAFSTPLLYGEGANYKIQDFSGQVTNVINSANLLNLPPVPTVSGITDFGTACLINYEISNIALVKTFQREAYYTGITTSQFGSSSAESKDAVFRIILDVEKNKATAVIYNAQFAPMMPKLTFILRDLQLVYTRDGYKVSGENIVPEGVDKSPYPAFPFDSFTLSTSDKFLTTATIDFSVASKYQGQFKGSLLYSQK